MKVFVQRQKAGIGGLLNIENFSDIPTTLRVITI